MVKKIIISKRPLRVRSFVRSWYGKRETINEMIKPSLSGAFRHAVVSRKVHSWTYPALVPELSISLVPCGAVKRSIRDSLTLTRSRCCRLCAWLLFKGGLSVPSRATAITFSRVALYRKSVHTVCKWKMGKSWSFGADMDGQ